MKSILMQVEEATRLLEEKPYLAQWLSREEEERYWEAERALLVHSIELYTPLLEKYLESKEGRAIKRLLKEVRELEDADSEGHRWRRWTIVLYKSSVYPRPNREEVIYFDGDGLELSFVENGSNRFHVKPITPRELITRMVTNRFRFDQAEISRPEQVIPYIRTQALSLVRYLNR